jgi:ketosteroid isomerase-like protein
MTTDEAHRIRQAYETFNAGGGIDFSMFHPAVRNDHSEGLFLDGVFYGTEGVRAAFEEIAADWDDLRFVVEDSVDLGGRHLVFLRIHARVRDTQAELDAQVAHVWEFRDGQVVQWDIYGSRAAAMRALGGFGPSKTLH